MFVLWINGRNCHLIFILGRIAGKTPKQAGETLPVLVIMPAKYGETALFGS
jgi:hypothetical protein